VRHFSDLVDPRNALLSDDDVRAAQALLRRAADARAAAAGGGGARAGAGSPRSPGAPGAPGAPAGAPPPPPTDDALWAAKLAVDSALHPDTGEPIPLLFRMSMFMPANLPITAGMLSGGGPGVQLFWQWANQSYNAGFNYANRNASVPVDAAGLAASYAVATGVACGLSYTLGRAVDRLTAAATAAAPPGAAPPLSLRLVSRALPWFAVASAGAANALAMRYKEGVEGITVYDADGAPAGTSVAAGRRSLALVALTRAALPVPVLLLPPFALDAVRATPVGALMARSAPARLAVELGVFAAFLQGALPLAVALFPQKGAVRAGDLEERFHGRGKDYVYTYNKGL